MVLAFPPGTPLDGLYSIMDDNNCELTARPFEITVDQLPIVPFP